MSTGPGDASAATTHGSGSPDLGRRFDRRGWMVGAFVTALLCLHYVLAVGSKLHESTTSDELPHLTAGYSYWAHNDYRLQPENGNLPQRWAALPTFLRGATFPALQSEDWAASNVWSIGYDFLYRTGEDHVPKLRAGRAMIALFSVATGLLVFFWSRALFGSAGALLSLSLFSFSPIFLAHGALATSDVCMAFFFLASVGAYWRHLHDERARMAILSALVFGLACVAKFSAVLLLPMLGLLGLARVFEPEPLVFRGRRTGSRGGKLAAVAVSGILHAAVALVVIWAFYGFRYSAANPALPPMSQFILPWESLLAGFQGRVIRIAASLRLLPEAFLYGYTYVIHSAESRSAFLNGEYSMTGWRTFFPWAFLLKTTLPVLIACVVLVWITARRWARQRTRVIHDCLRVLPLVVLFVTYWAFSITSHLNIGQRHILPTYPVLFIAAGAIAAAAVQWRSRLLLGLTLLLPCWQALEAARIAPHFIAYFNPIGGGPSQSYRHLVDSSLDWGQDLPALEEWLDRHAPPSSPVFLAYFGTGSPEYFGMRATRLMTISVSPLRRDVVELKPGIYCIGATALQQVYNGARGPWTLSFERTFQQLKLLEPAFRDISSNPSRLNDWKSVLPTDWERAQSDYEQLRFARLCHLLRAREPDAQVGYSILIYRVSQADIDAVQGSLAAWSDAIRSSIEARQRRR